MIYLTGEWPALGQGRKVMSESKAISQSKQFSEPNFYPVRDISDFCARWPNLENHVSEEKLAGSDLPKESQEIVRWLRLMASRVCAAHSISGLEIID